MAGTPKAPTTDNLGDGFRNILQSVVACMSIPGAPIPDLMKLQVATLGMAQKISQPQQPQGGQPQGGQPQGQPGMSPGGMPPGGQPQPGMSPPMAGGGAPNQQQVAPQPGQSPRGMMNGQGINAMSSDPDELRRILQQRAAS